MTEINREQWQRIEREFGQTEEEAEPLRPRVQLDESRIQVEFGEGESNVSAWAMPKSTRIDTEGLSLYVSVDRLLLLKRLGPYPTQRWQVLYDSAEPTSAAETDPNQSLHPTQQLSSSSLYLTQQLIAVLRDGLGLHWRGRVDETDPAVPLVEDHLLKVVPFGNATQLRDLAVTIVRTVRAMVPNR